MKKYKDLMKEFRAMSIDLDKARKNKIFKSDVDKAEKIIFALIRDGYAKFDWNITSNYWELSIVTPAKDIEHFKGKTPYETLKTAMKKLRIRL